MSLSKGCGIAIAVVALLFGLIAYGGYSVYSSTKVDRTILDLESTTWIASFNTKRFADCYARADGSLRAATSESVYVKQLEKLFADHGALMLGQQTGFYINSNNGMSTATCQWKATGLQGNVEVVLLFAKQVNWGITGCIVRSTPAH